ncbi:hypothetical protein GCM10011579_094980 [Streptomyces albiflavescens]|uniref:Uncharacterized protein n=1 Tax=Streptomyces albiflavescens TaxID=1623582 RepID=A0A917YEQ6_9ACTN|nr:hypothetical protein [Streptomyces albiflavescens]GGN94926.1 hypothetical protein GCM10011579_094980 [Streptomyces albiflavescens]
MSNGIGAPPPHRPRIGKASRGARTVLRALAVVLIGCFAALGVAASATAADDDDLIKVFVVQDPAQTGGQLATLASIAAGTLGDASRAGEILELNRGLAQPDGGALNSADDQLRPGWILRLPPDASGPDVRQARDTGNQNTASAAPDGAGAPSGGNGTTAAGSTMFTIPLAAAVAVLGAIVLALVTAGIVGRRKVRGAYGAVMRAVRRLGAPVRRRRRLMLRRALGRRFATDADSVRRAYGTLAEFAAVRSRPETPVHALRVDNAGATVWLAASDTLEAPWRNVDSTRWRRPTAEAGWLNGGPEDGGTASRAAISAACLVRVGTDTEGKPVFVDLSRLDGVLSVTGDHGVARDVVQNVLAEIARIRPETPVTVLRGADGAPPPILPAGLTQLGRAELPAGTGAMAVHGTVRAAASRRPVKGLVVVAGTPTGQEAAELAALCGPGGAGWTGLVYGEVSGAHWRWYTDADGDVDIPVLDVKLTVPA